MQNLVHSRQVHLNVCLGIRREAQSDLRLVGLKYDVLELSFTNNFGAILLAILRKCEGFV